MIEGGSGVPPFHVHPGHRFEGFELVRGELRARCECGEVLDTAEARFTDCPACGGQDGSCPRCAGTGHVVDHAAVEWRSPAQ